MVDAVFVASFTADGGARVQMQRQTAGRGLFARSRMEILQTQGWPEADASGTAIRLLDFASRGEAEDMGDALLLPPKSIAGLTEPLALAAGLPPAAPLLLSLKGRGLITDPGFVVEARWVRADGTGVAAQVNGAHARISGRDYRLPEPLYGLAESAAALAAAGDVAAQQEAFARLRQQLEAHHDGAIVDGILRETRVAFAGHFSLALSGSNFDPVLFAPQIGDAVEAGTLVDEQVDNLLTPAQQDAFARQFRQRQGRAGSYLLPDGVLLFTDPTLSRALGIVGERQRAPEAERRRFAAAPRRAIREALGETDHPLEALFIETAQYSERVVGIDTWTKPVLPWVRQKPNSWLPDSFGLAIGDPPVRLELPPDGLPDAIAEVERAIAAEVATVQLAGVAVPATPATLDALKALAQLSEPGTSEKEAQPSAPPPTLAGKFFLQVQDNLEDVIYASLVAPSPSAQPTPTLPASVRTALKPHQVSGFRWLAAAWAASLPGLLLADDMGLGKTLQALAFFCWLREAGNRDPILVVAPTGLLANWQAEIDRHLVPGALGPVLRAWGAALASHRDGAGTDIANGAARIDTRDWRDAGVVLTTYETMRDYHISMARVPFAAVVFDEAQRLKNPAAQVTRAAKTLRARLTLALTGTPVENRLQDLWSITDVVHPGLLGSSKAFEARYGAAQVDTLRELNAQLTTAVGAQPPFMLRRMKADHVDGLPTKSEQLRALPMPPMQANAYSQAVQRAFALKGTEGREAILQTLARLRSISLAPALPVVGPEFAAHSARLQATFAILDELAAVGEKALIFCESLELQPLLAAELRRRYRMPRAVAFISGQVPGDVRQRMVSAFQAAPAGFDVMILSPRAGGVGLTITAANHVIHLTRWWNPAVEDQATDRVYRIGQTRDVTVWIPLAEHPDPILTAASFDRRLADLLARKRSLAHGLLAEPESDGDAASLFADVVPDAMAEPPIETGPPQADPAPIVGASQPALSVAASVTGISAPSNAAPNRRFVKRSNQPVPWQVFTEVLAGRSVRLIDIVDPFAAASTAQCRALAEFLAGLLERGVRFESVALTCWEAESLAGGVDDSAAQRRALQTALSHFKLGDLRFHPSFVSRRQTKLHDRSVTARLVDGGIIVWDLGGGIDALMSARAECTIGRWVEPAEGVA